MVSWSQFYFIYGNENMHTVTINDVMSFEPCGFNKENDGKHYTLERVTDLFDGRENVNGLDVLNSSIPSEDKLWLALHNPFFSDRDLHWLACQFASWSLHFFEENCPGDKRPRQAIETKLRWLDGKATDVELAAARNAVENAAARNAAWAVARAAAWAAAAENAARAAWAAAWAAAWDAAGNAARDVFIEIIKTKLIGNDL